MVVYDYYSMSRLFQGRGGLLCVCISLWVCAPSAPSILLTPLPSPGMQQLRVSQVTQGRTAKSFRIKVVRKSIARVLTVYNQQRKSNVSQQQY